TFRKRRVFHYYGKYWKSGWIAPYPPIFCCCLCAYLIYRISSADKRVSYTMGCAVRKRRCSFKTEKDIGTTGRISWKYRGRYLGTATLYCYFGALGY